MENCSGNLLSDSVSCPVMDTNRHACRFLSPPIVHVFLTHLSLPIDHSLVERKNIGLVNFKVDRRRNDMAKTSAAPWRMAPTKWIVVTRRCHLSESGSPVGSVNEFASCRVRKHRRKVNEPIGDMMSNQNIYEWVSVSLCDRHRLNVIQSSNAYACTVFFLSTIVLSFPITHRW